MSCFSFVMLVFLVVRYLGVTLRKKNPRLMRANFAAKRRSVLYRKVMRQQSTEEVTAVDKVLSNQPTNKRASWYSNGRMKWSRSSSKLMC